MKILDATCGTKSIWYQKDLPFVTFMDKRSQIINTLQNGNALKTKRVFRVKPDVIADWTKELPFSDGAFDLVVFDPPQCVKKDHWKESVIHKRYGFLDEKTWRMDLEKGAAELFRVLRDDGFFILKWSEREIPLDDVLKLLPYQPLFGTRAGQRNNTHWILFVKRQINGRLPLITEDESRRRIMK
jgi:SAM-dependent methyltransferase